MSFSPTRTTKRILILVAFVVQLLLTLQSSDMRVIQASQVLLSHFEEIAAASMAYLEPAKLGDEETQDDETFSACVLVMDENHRLAEWIAYHYYALPLRYLVIAVDPYSSTSPKEILDRWKDRITIHQWSDSDFTDPNMIKRPVDVDNATRFVVNDGLHLKRQSYFNKACMLFLQSQNRTWISMGDLDEYVSPNPQVLGQNLSDATVAKPGFALRLVKQLRSNTSVMENTPAPWAAHYNYSHCITLPRATYSAKESDESDVAKHVPAFLKARQFETLRWRYRSVDRRGNGRIDLVKSFVDVSKIRPRDFGVFANAHRPLPAVCPGVFQYYNNNPLGFHHYMTSWELFSSRKNDARGRSYDYWKKSALQDAGGPDDDIRPWIAGFVKLVGQEAAVQLLLGAGDLPIEENATTLASA